jgi:PHD/YefM family antitoxin component YafN of YafNO toxin-antitoxin module
VLVSRDELESIEATPDLLFNPQAMQDILEADADIGAGNGMTADELRNTYGRR